MTRSAHGVALVVTLIGAGALGGCNRVDCASFCERVRRCDKELAAEMVKRLPGKSGLMEHVRRNFVARHGKRIRRSCRERCERDRASRRWKKEVVPCRKHKGCVAFAHCAAHAFEP